MTLSSYFMSNSRFRATVPAVVDLQVEGSTFKDSCVKSNKHQWLSIRAGTLSYPIQP